MVCHRLRDHLIRWRIKPRLIMRWRCKFNSDIRVIHGPGLARIAIGVLCSWSCRGVSVRESKKRVERATVVSEEGKILTIFSPTLSCGISTSAQPRSDTGIPGPEDVVLNPEPASKSSKDPWSACLNSSISLRKSLKIWSSLVFCMMGDKKPEYWRLLKVGSWTRCLIVRIFIWCVTVKGRKDLFD